MGFTTGFVSPFIHPLAAENADPFYAENADSDPLLSQLGGLTLTTTITYLTLSTHRMNRHHQALLLRQQSHTLLNIVEPLPPSPPPVARLARAGLLETIKDRWNGELENLVRRVQTTDWAKVRERSEERIGMVWRRLREEVGEMEKRS